jgi:NADPH:quinone reductase
MRLREGVGGFAIQLAKAAKAFVIGTSSEPNTQYVRELGADEVINYRAEDVFQRVKAIAGDRGIDAIIDTIGPSNSVDNLGLLGPEGGLACIAGIPDLSVVPDLPYSISIHDIGLGGVMASPAFRRRQEDLGRMATELMALSGEFAYRVVGGADHERATVMVLEVSISSAVR